MANALVDTDLPFPSYGAISDSPETRTVPAHTPESLIHIYFYIYDVISVVQGGLDRQDRFFDCKVYALKWLFPSLLGEIKVSVSVNNIILGVRDWTFVREVLGWILETEVGTVTHPQRGSLRSSSLWWICPPPSTGWAERT